MKTVTMRVDDAVYEVIKMAAAGQKRNISNFLEFAMIQYLTSSQYVDNSEMEEILGDQDLVKSLKSALTDADNGDYTIV